MSVQFAEEVTITKSSVKNLTAQRIIQQFKLNHRIFSDGNSIQLSKQAIFIDSDLDICLYNEVPMVYTNINNSRSSDYCINYPIAEFTFKGELLESFSKHMDNYEKLHELYGQSFARKILVGNKLFIKNLNLATPTQIDILQSHLTWAYNSAKYNTKNPFNHLSDLHHLSKIETSDGKEITTSEYLASWMNNLYQQNIDTLEIISYDDIIPVSKLRLNTLPNDFKSFQPGVTNFEKKLSFKEWAGDAVYINLTRWIKDFHLSQGLIFNKNHEIEISKKIAIDFIKVPEINSINESYLEIIKVKKKLELILVSNKIFSIIKKKDNYECIKRGIMFSDDEDINGNYHHCLVKSAQYEILMTKDHINPLKEFKQSIEEALNNIRPFKALQDVFYEYGHLFPKRIVLGKSLKNILQTTFHDPYIKIDLESSNLDKLNTSYFLTQYEDIIEKDDLPSWIQDINNNLEIIEFDKIIHLYEILGEEQRRKIDIISNHDVNKVIITGITNL